MKLIALTRKDGGIVYLNIQYIIGFFETYKGATFVFDTSGGDAWEVRETTEQIIELIRNL
jgi:hypothetical protein